MLEGGILVQKEIRQELRVEEKVILKNFASEEFLTV